MRSDDFQAIGGALVALKVCLAPTPLCCATTLVLGLTAWEFLFSPDFVKLVSFLIALVAFGVNIFCNPQIRELRALRRDVNVNSARRLEMEVELAQVSAEILREKGTFKHSGRRIPLRPSVPPAAVEVLVVDDHKVTLDAMGRLLRHYGFQVQVCGTVTESIVLVRGRESGGHRFDFIVLDLMLPDGSGVELLEHIRRNRLASEVIVMTGAADDAMLAAARAAGARAILVKPIEPRELLAIMGCNTDEPPVADEAAA